VPEKLKGHKSLEKFKTAEDAINGYLNLESAYGKKFEENLKDDAAPEVKARVNSALGVPESADAYEFVEIPKDQALDPSIVGSFKEAGHKLRLSKSQFKGISEWYVDKELERQQRAAHERAESEKKGMESLNKDWGAATERNVALVQQLVAEVAGKDVAEYLNTSGMTNDARMVRFLHGLALKLAEDKMITPNPVGLSTDDAKAELAKIRAAAAADKKHPYTDRDHPEHKRVVQRVHELYQLANPGA
jgi:hypothetical protein